LDDAPVHGVPAAAVASVAPWHNVPPWCVVRVPAARGRRVNGAGARLRLPLAARGAEEGEDRRQLTPHRVARTVGRRVVVVWIAALTPRTGCVPSPVGIVYLPGPLDRC